MDTPAQHEAVDCALCSASGEDAIVVGTRARFGLPVRNVACQACGLVYVNPRPTPAALEAYYRDQYRSHYHGVKITAADGRPVGPEDEGFPEVWAERRKNQAQTALHLGGVQPGGRVLEVGCGDGQSLAFMRDLGGVTVEGIEPDVAQAALASERGIECFAGLLESFDPGERRYDQVQMFHVLEHVVDPVDALLRMRRLLAPGGRLLIEVPDVRQPYGALEGNFFQNAHLFSYSASTLAALFSRAGLTPLRMAEVGTLYMTGERDGRSDDDLPRAFEPSFLVHSEEDGAFIAERLDTYRILEPMVREILREMNMDRLQSFCQALSRPSFLPVLVHSVTQVVEHVLRYDAHRVASIILKAAARGPHPTELTSTWLRQAAQLDSLSAPPAPSP